MKYLKLYEEFKILQDLIDKEVIEKPEIEITDTTIDDVLKDDFFDQVKQDSNGVYQILNWEVY